MAHPGGVVNDSTMLILGAAIVAGAGLAGTAVASALTWATIRLFKRKMQALDVTYLPVSTTRKVETDQDVHDVYEDRPDVLAIVKTVTLPEGRKLGRQIGVALRLQLGLPSPTPANRTLATQRAEAWIREHAPSLRVAHRSAVVAHAVYWTLTPGDDELHTMSLLCSREAYRRERQLRVPRPIPRYDAIPVCIQEFMGWTINPLPDFHQA